MRTNFELLSCWNVPNTHPCLSMSLRFQLKRLRAYDENKELLNFLVSRFLWENFLKLSCVESCASRENSFRINFAQAFWLRNYFIICATINNHIQNFHCRLADYSDVSISQPNNNQSKFFRYRSVFSMSKRKILLTYVKHSRIQRIIFFVEVNIIPRQATNFTDSHSRMKQNQNLYVVRRTERI